MSVDGDLTIDAESIFNEPDKLSDEENMRRQAEQMRVKGKKYPPVWDGESNIHDSVQTLIIC